ncbi:DUF692 domain-containing protein [Pseudomonas proteolytica]|jgi:uncharacterized protein (UPF0276 family)|uniref:MNIO family bufferin maturase n=1 Tax=Pseudomonas proteolytica TaxID=219574 RepID=UPI0014763F1D|nr:DUF692 domain-containing protein [Pseudomonas proteolytica]MBC3337879.1 DUF692 domain-containing protein [Pseudomonas proteolytica]NMY96419.1 DUF692 domain-containing protein [Pseudomonas proteolytica]
MTLSSLPDVAQAQAPGLPRRAGLGLKSEHFQQVLATLPDIGFFEVHAENYMVAGGPFHHYLGLIREHYALSLHGVGLSIGGEGPLDHAHLARLAALVERYQPHSFSEHLAWSSHGPVFLNDLLPLAYDDATLKRVCEHIDQVQSTLKRRMLLENPSTYLLFQHSSLDETDFISEVIQRTGCGLLLDVNNVYVSCINHQQDPLAYLNALPLHSVGEIHLAGFAEDADSLGDRLLIDDHGAPVDNAVWQLYQQALQRTGPVATLIERDNDVPAFSVLHAEARQADRHLLAAAVHP